LLIFGGLTACERPAPGSEAPPATATVGVPGLGATLLPPVGASPTPTPGATIDPNAPVGASPTPDPAATVDPAAQPVQPTTVPVAPEPTAAPTQVTAPTGEIVHIVQAGENLYRIGLRYGFTAEQLAAYNGIPNVNVISIGQQIRIPPSP
jgi:LysM repeat protein